MRQCVCGCDMPDACVVFGCTAPFAPPWGIQSQTAHHLAAIRCRLRCPTLLCPALPCTTLRCAGLPCPALPCNVLCTHRVALHRQAPTHQACRHRHLDCLDHISCLIHLPPCCIQPQRPRPDSRSRRHHRPHPGHARCCRCQRCCWHACRCCWRCEHGAHAAWQARDCCWHACCCGCCGCQAGYASKGRLHAKSAARTKRNEFRCNFMQIEQVFVSTGIAAAALCTLAHAHHAPASDAGCLNSTAMQLPCATHFEAISTAFAAFAATSAALTAPGRPPGARGLAVAASAAADGCAPAAAVPAVCKAGTFLSFSRRAFCFSSSSLAFCSASCAPAAAAKQQQRTWLPSQPVTILPAKWVQSMPHMSNNPPG